MDQQQAAQVDARLQRIEESIASLSSAPSLDKQDLADLLELFRMVKTWLKAIAWVCKWLGWILKKVGLVIAPLVSAAIAIYMLWKGQPPKL